MSMLGYRLCLLALLILLEASPSSSANSAGQATGAGGSGGHSVILPEAPLPANPSSRVEERAPRRNLKKENTLSPAHPLTLSPSQASVPADVTACLRWRMIGPFRGGRT